MKRILLMIGMLIAFAGVVWAVDDGAGAYRIFTSKEGRSIEGRIMKYDARQGKIQMERRGAGFVWVTPDVFDEADQTYIQEWVAADLFLSESKLGISVEEHARSVGKSRKDLTDQTTGFVYYEVQLDNRSDITFNHLKLDYQLYIGKRMYRGGSARPRCVTGVVKLKSLSAGSKKKCMTKAEELITKYSSDSSFNTVTRELESSISKRSKDVPQGVLIRLQGPTVGGVPVMREFSYPASFGEKVEWSESTDKKKSKPAGALTYDELIQKARAHKYGSGVKKDYKKAIALYEQASELDPTKAEENAYNIFDIRLKMRTVSSHSLAEEWAEKKDAYSPYRMLAIFYGSEAPSEFLNGEKAVKYATQAAEKNYDGAVAILAIAYARNGQFDLAVETQEAAIKSLKRTKYSKSKLKQYKFLYALFEQRKAYTAGMKAEAH